jgi:hypothetical protein
MLHKINQKNPLQINILINAQLSQREASSKLTMLFKELLQLFFLPLRS